MINPDNAPEKQKAFSESLQAMDIPALFKKTKEMIWLSAYASNNPRSCYHWQCDATYTEWVRRSGSSNKYGEAHKEVMAAEGYR